MITIDFSDRDLSGDNIREEDLKADYTLQRTSLFAKNFKDSIKACSNQKSCISVIKIIIKKILANPGKSI